MLDHMGLTPWLPQVLTSWSWSHTKALGIKRLEFNAKNQEAGKNHHLYNVEESPPQKHVLLHQERMSVVFLMFFFFLFIYLFIYELEILLRTTKTKEGGFLPISKEPKNLQAKDYFVKK